MNFNPDDHQNCLHLFVCTHGHSDLVIYHTMFSKIHIWITLNSYPKMVSKYGPNQTIAPRGENTDHQQPHSIKNTIKNSK